MVAFQNCQIWQGCPNEYIDLKNHLPSCHQFEPQIVHPNCECEECTEAFTDEVELKDNGATYEKQETQD